MIYSDPIFLGSKSLINAWLKNVYPKFFSLKQHIQTTKLLFDWLFEACLNFVIEKCEQYVSCGRMHLTASFLKLFECMLTEIR